MIKKLTWFSWEMGPLVDFVFRFSAEYFYPPFTGCEGDMSLPSVANLTWNTFLHGYSSELNFVYHILLSHQLGGLRPQAMKGPYSDQEQLEIAR